MKFGGFSRSRSGRFLAWMLILLIYVTLFPDGAGTVLCGAEEQADTADSGELKENGEEKPKWEGDRIYFAAFGDSIAKGYAGRGEEDLRSYTQLLADDVSAETGIPAECENFAKNGRDSERLNSEILGTEEVLAALDRADIITLTIGANDLMQEFRRAAQEVLGTDRKFLSVYDAFDALQEGVGGNPLLIVKILDVLNNWDYTMFEEQWIMAMETIAEHRKDTAQMIVTNIYNPVSRFELPESMNGIVEDIILNMNQIMYEHAEEYDYRVIDLFDSEICEHTQEDGLHPDQEGQALIAELAAEKIDTGIFKGEPEKIIEEAPRPRKVERRRYSLWTVLGPLSWILPAILAGVAAVLFIWLFKRKKSGESAALYRKRNKNIGKND